MPRVLIITYYWPPSGGSSVLRWLKFTKYFREFGWEPVIYTPLNPESQEIDPALEKDIPENVEIIRTPIWEPYGIYKRLTGRKPGDRLGVALMTDKKTSAWFGKLSLWIRSNLFIPDPKRFWISPSVRYLTKFISANRIDVVVTTGPPHSMHLIGLGLKKKTGIKWVADFRDPWTNIDFYSDLLLTKMADKRHRQLEKQILLNADCVVTVSDTWAEEFRQLGGIRVKTIMNGFDYEPILPHMEEKDNKFSILHLGSIPLSRNPENFWKVLSDLVNENAEFASALQIKLIGKVDLKVIEALEVNKLKNYLKYESFIPHELTYQQLTSASVLLLIINNTPNSQGILTNKFYEYLSAHRPILALGPVEGDASKILSNTAAGKIFNYSDTQALRQHLLNLFKLYQQGNLKVDPKEIDRYSRKSLTAEMVQLFNTFLN